MTIREIAETAGISVDSVTRKAKDLFPARFEKGKKTIFTNKEGLQVMAEIRKKNFVELPQSAEVLPQNAEVSQGIQEILHIMARAYDNVTQIVKSQEARLQKIEGRIEERKAILPAPQIKPRDNVSKIVREFAHNTGKPHRDVWGELYKQFGYRTNTHPRRCASNRGMAIIDYIEAEGQIETLEAVAIEIFGGQ